MQIQMPDNLPKGIAQRKSSQLSLSLSWYHPPWMAVFQGIRFRVYLCVCVCVRACVWQWFICGGSQGCVYIVAMIPRKCLCLCVCTCTVQQSVLLVCVWWSQVSAYLLHTNFSTWVIIQHVRYSGMFLIRINSTLVERQPARNLKTCPYGT